VRAWPARPGVGGRDLQALLGTPRSVSCLLAHSFVAGLRLQASSEPDCRSPIPSDGSLNRPRSPLHLLRAVCCSLPLLVPSQVPVRPSLPASFQSPFFFARTMEMGRAALLASCAHRTMHGVSQSACACSTLSLPVGSCSFIVSLPTSSCGCVRGVRRAATAGGRAASVGSW